KVTVYLNAATEQWDVIFLDPPYNKNMVNDTIKLIKDKDLLAPDGIIIVEHHPQEKIAEEFRPLVVNYKQNSRITAFTVLQ
ncbi:MAG: RsmD family RNA methyltransferase, partial [Candidatus Cloacimonadaceae bacterium]